LLFVSVGFKGEMLFYFCRGIDEREVETDYERKSLGTEETFAQDLSRFDEMKVNLIRMSEELIDELKNYPDKSIKNIHVKIKYSDFKQTTIERQLDLKSEHFLELFSERWAQDPRPIRLLGVGVKFEDELPKNPGQLSLLT
jgi:DNA polymerase-4